MKKSDEPTVKYEFQARLLLAVGIGAFATAGVVCLLLLFNYVQFKTTDPLNSPALALMIEEHQRQPENVELAEEIRAMDLLIRKGFFTSIWMLNTGSLLIIISAGAGLLALRVRQSLMLKLPGPAAFGAAEKSDLESQRKLPVSLVPAGILIILGVLFNLNTRELITDPQSLLPDIPIPEPGDIEANWPGFRGPWGNAVAAGEGYPLEWDGPSGLNILWKSAVPLPGFSSPVVWDDRIFITGGNAESRILYCYRLSDGSLLWEREIPSPPHIAAKLADLYLDPGTGFAAPSAATDGNSVCGIFATGDLACFDFLGNPTWQKALGIPDNHYAHSSSLLIFEDLLFVQLDHFENPRLYAFDVNTGRIRWEADRQTISWASPICVNTGARWELILADSKSVISYDPATGKQLWKSDCLGGEVGPSPAFGSGHVVVANEYARGTALKLPVEPDDSTVVIAWQEKRKLPNTASPLIAGDITLWATAGGTVSCFDLINGRKLWQEEFRNGFYSSPILANGFVYLTDRKGSTFVFNEAQTYQQIFRNELGEPSSSTTAFIDSRILLRGENHLFCIGQ